MKNENTLLLSSCLYCHKVEKTSACKVENLHSTDDGESSEKSHGASNCRQHVHKLCSSVLGDFVKSWGVKVNSYEFKFVLPVKI